MTSLLTLERLAIMSNPRQILLSTRIRSSAFFGGVTGVTRMNPAASARCATPIPKTFEIALVLDNTGSMADAGGDGVTKIAALKSAAIFVNYVFKNPASAAGTRMSIVPVRGCRRGRSRDLPPRLLGRSERQVSLSLDERDGRLRGRIHRPL